MKEFGVDIHDYADNVVMKAAARKGKGEREGKDLDDRRIFR